jgi:tRNA G18 (ribose-2'-O)-methylase SpoU
MMPLVPVHRFDDPRIADYRSVPDPELLRRRGLFVAEGRLVVRTLLTSSRFQALSVLVTETARRSLESVLAPRIETLPVYVADRSLLAEIVGFNVKAVADARVRIPMVPGVDSLNVATASGIALHRLGGLPPAPSARARVAPR